MKQENTKSGTNGTMWGKRKAERQGAGEKAANVHACLLFMFVYLYLFLILMDNHSLPKIDLGVIDKSISEITAIKWQNLELLNHRSLGDDQGVGIKSVTYANWMRSLDDDSFMTTVLPHILNC